jgi:hypothetical protein
MVAPRGQRCGLGAETQRILPLRLEMARHRQDHIQGKRRVVYGGQRCFKHPLTVSSGHGHEQGLAHGQLSFIDWPDRLTDAGSGHRLNGRIFWQRYENRASVVCCAVQRQHSQHSHSSRTTLTASPSTCDSQRAVFVATALPDGGAQLRWPFSCSPLGECGWAMRTQTVDATACLQAANQRNAARHLVCAGHAATVGGLLANIFSALNYAKPPLYH